MRFCNYAEKKMRHVPDCGHDPDPRHDLLIPHNVSCLLWPILFNPVKRKTICKMIGMRYLPRKVHFSLSPFSTSWPPNQFRGWETVLSSQLSQNSALSLHAFIASPNVKDNFVDGPRQGRGQCFPGQPRPIALPQHTPLRERRGGKSP